jgi:hypothetical protein
MAVDLTLIKWKYESKMWTLNRLLVCKLVGHHWKRVEGFPASCTRCMVLLEQRTPVTDKPAHSWAKGNIC